MKTNLNVEKFGNLLPNFLINSVNNKFFHEYKFLEPFFDFQKDPNEADQQISDISNFADLPVHFLIINLENVIKDNLLPNKYLHIYFIKHEERITLLFVFSLKSECNLPFGDKDAIYVLNDNQELDLVDKSSYGIYRDAILQYYIYFHQTFQNHTVTTYITYSLDRIQSNFTSLQNGDLKVAAFTEDRKIFRPMLILEIDQSCCKGELQYSANNSGKVYYDLGNLKP